MIFIRALFGTKPKLAIKDDFPGEGTGKSESSWSRPASILKATSRHIRVESTVGNLGLYKQRKNNKSSSRLQGEVKPHFTSEANKSARQLLDKAFADVGVPAPMTEKEEETLIEVEEKLRKSTSESDVESLQEKLAKQLRRKTLSHISVHAIGLSQLFDYNRKWAAEQIASDPAYFEKNSETQRPDYLWIGCSDSRVTANEICGLKQGELFVHRNVANLVQINDPNAGSVIQYAVENLGVRHIIVCGHYRCGGVRACYGPKVPEPLETWISPLRGLVEEKKAMLAEIDDEDLRWRYLCEENVKAQVDVLEKMSVIREAWARGQALAVHVRFFAVARSPLPFLLFCA